MGGGVTGVLACVVSASDREARRVENERRDGNVTTGQREPGLDEGGAHPLVCRAHG